MKAARFHAVAHADEIAYGQALLAVVKVGDRPVWKKGHHRLVELELALVGGNGNQGGGNALGHGAEIVGERSVVWRKSGIQHHITIADDHQAVNGNVFVKDGLNAFGKPDRIETLLLRGCVLPTACRPIVRHRLGWQVATTR